MYLNKLKKPNGDIYLSIREKYHVPGKGSRERTVESIGYLSVLKKTIDAPIGYYDQYAKKLTEEKNAERHQVVEIDKPYRRIGTIPYRYWDCAGFASKLEIYYHVRANL